MTKMTVLQMPLFKKMYKKLHPKEKAYVDNAVQAIVKNPKLGQLKKGDLNDVFVYKFKTHHNETLLAYELDPKTMILLALGPHENFYRDLKKNLYH